MCLSLLQNVTDFEEIFKEELDKAFGTAASQDPKSRAIYKEIMSKLPAMRDPADEDEDLELVGGDNADNWRVSELSSHLLIARRTALHLLTARSTRDVLTCGLVWQ